jgi:peptide deformylase
VGVDCCGWVTRCFYQIGSATVRGSRATIRPTNPDTSIYLISALLTMPSLPIVLYPDPILRRMSDPVESFSRELKDLVDAMFETMYTEKGIGLAAPQIGRSQRLIVVDTSNAAPAPIALVNPEIVAYSGTTEYEEGCLSVPGYRAKVTRHASVSIRAQSVTGEAFQIHADGLQAICLQHEIDHLNGVLFFDHLSPLKKNMFGRWWKKHGKESSNS